MCFPPKALLKQLLWIKWLVDVLLLNQIAQPNSQYLPCNRRTTFIISLHRRKKYILIHSEKILNYYFYGLNSRTRASENIRCSSDPLWRNSAILRTLFSPSPSLWINPGDGPTITKRTHNRLIWHTMEFQNTMKRTSVKSLQKENGCHNKRRMQIAHLKISSTES